MYATGLDLIGGYIPGDHQTQGQQYASVIWSLGQMGGGLDFAGKTIIGTSEVIKRVGQARTASSAIINAFEGNTKQALLDVAGLAIGHYSTSLATQAKALRTDAIRPIYDGDQLVSPVLLGLEKTTQALAKAASLMKASEVIKVGKAMLGLGRKVQKTYGAGFAPFFLGQQAPSEGASLAEPPTSTPSEIGGQALGGTPSGGPSGGGGECGLGEPPRPSLGLDNVPGLDASNVGGIYLRGAAKALESLGALKGVMIDDNGRLVLLSEEKGQIDLPPLRLDDVVTIFRSVYEHGDAPYVSIDPDPQNPKGSKMIVRHGEGTADSYVGWVLFEADRMMKSYSLGRDNITRTSIQSRIPGYQSLLGLGLTDDEKTWERFWIVPAAVNGRRSPNQRLTLVDVPLKIKTQRMVMRHGKLEPAPNAQPSQAAKKFAAWFTDNYDDVAKETMSQPPEAMGLKNAIPVYTELRRMALISAIAEALRNRNIRHLSNTS